MGLSRLGFFSASLLDSVWDPTLFFLISSNHVPGPCILRLLPSLFTQSDISVRIFPSPPTLHFSLIALPCFYVLPGDADTDTQPTKYWWSTAEWTTTRVWIPSCQNLGNYLHLTLLEAVCRPPFKAACTSPGNHYVRRSLVSHWVWVITLLQNGSFSFKKQTKHHNVGHFYTQGTFWPMFWFGNSKREKVTLQIKVKPCVLKFLFKEKHWFWDGHIFWYCWLSKFLLKNSKMLSRMVIV